MSVFIILCRLRCVVYHDVRPVNRYSMMRKSQQDGRLMTLTLTLRELKLHLIVSPETKFLGETMFSPLNRTIYSTQIHSANEKH